MLAYVVVYLFLTAKLVQVKSITTLTSNEASSELWSSIILRGITGEEMSDEHMIFPPKNVHTTALFSILHCALG